jgi:integrase/recombinase XerD
MTSVESADDLARSLGTFFSEHLPVRTGASRHTILAYRDAWKLFLRFAATRATRSVPELRLTDLDVETVLAFLDSLERDRHNAAVTRNHRRTALQAFFRYLPSVAPEYLAHSQRILSIPVKRAPRRTVDYLERPEMEALAQVDRHSRQGRRDYALLAFLYNSGARVQEATDLGVAALQLDRPYQVRLFGKGRKERVCPLWPETAALLRVARGTRREPGRHRARLRQRARSASDAIRHPPYRESSCCGRREDTTLDRPKANPSSHAETFVCGRPATSWSRTEPDPQLARARQPGDHSTLRGN